MSRKQDTWLSRIKAVEREHAAVRFATNRLLEEAEHDPTVIKINVSLREIRNASGRLEGTYVVRLFAEFESGLRSCWSAVRGTDPPSRAVDLVNGTAARHAIPHDYIENVHAVRNYRNDLVHERVEVGEPISIAKARGDVCRFFGFLPPDW
ncbi:MAG: hypothetical protein JO116_19295 [Planctomycetaceae bacterium]|nr:hypothetical protein [Planctomycetaceae bacterium]